MTTASDSAQLEGLLNDRAIGKMAIKAMWAVLVVVFAGMMISGGFGVRMLLGAFEADRRQDAAQTKAIDELTIGVRGLTTEIQVIRLDHSNRMTKIEAKIPQVERDIAEVKAEQSSQRTRRRARSK